MNVALFKQEIEIAGFPKPEERSASGQLVMPCPLCHDDKSRLYISSDHGAWICHRCGDKGSLFDFCIEILDESPEDAIELVGRLRRTESARETLPARPRTNYAVLPAVPLPLGFTPVNGPSAAMEYLAMRGVTEELIAKHSIGFTIIGPARYRVVVPVTTEGRLRTWVARTWLSPGGAWADPKVLNAPNSLAGRALFNYDNDRGNNMWPTGPVEPCVILTESVFDSMSLERRHFWAMSTLGAHITDDQRRLLKRKGIKRVVLMRDGDLAGRSAAKVEAQELRAAFFKVAIANLPDTVDPASATDKQIVTALADMEDFE